MIKFSSLGKKKKKEKAGGGGKEKEQNQHMKTGWLRVAETVQLPLWKLKFLSPVILTSKILSNRQLGWRLEVPGLPAVSQGTWNS